MKQTSQPGRRLKKPSRQAPAKTESVPAQNGLVRWLGPALCLVFAAAATYFLVNNIILSKLPHTLVGKWTATTGEARGSTLEFRADGTMIATVSGRDGASVSNVYVEGTTLWTTTVDPVTSKEEWEPQEIVTLTENRLVIEDKEGTVVELERMP